MLGEVEPSLLALGELAGGELYRMQLEDRLNEPRLTRWDARNGETQNISPWPMSSYGARPTSVTYHYGWITPIAVSRVPPHPLYQGAQVLFVALR